MIPQLEEKENTIISLDQSQKNKTHYTKATANPSASGAEHWLKGVAHGYAIATIG
jgi:hypothetical protein